MTKNRRVLRWPDVQKKISWTRQWCERLERQGKFPRRIRLGPQSVGWFEDEIDVWLEERQRGPLELTEQFKGKEGRAP